VRSHYTIKPRADCDIEDYADYLARNASLDVALRFLAAADETFSLLATQPNIGWHVRLRTPALGTLRMFRVAGFERMPFSTGRWKTGWIYSASSTAPQAENRVIGDQTNRQACSR
jgi:plasmid stabilization system protein ParE